MYKYLPTPHDKDIFNYIFPPRIDKKYKIWYIQTMKRDKIGKRVCDFRLEDLAEAKGISKRSVSRDIMNSRFNPNDPVSVCKWLQEPRYRRNKGKSLDWLNNKRGIRKEI